MLLEDRKKQVKRLWLRGVPLELLDEEQKGYRLRIADLIMAVESDEALDDLILLIIGAMEGAE